MANGCRICKVCGKEYEYCKTAVRTGMFRWQDVACCPEHGSEYLARIMASRNETPNLPFEPETIKEEQSIDIILDIEDDDEDDEVSEDEDE